MVKEVDEQSRFVMDALPQIIEFCDTIDGLLHSFEHTTAPTFHRQRVLNDMIMEKLRLRLWSTMTVISFSSLWGLMSVHTIVSLTKRLMLSIHMVMVISVSCDGADDELVSEFLE